MANYTEIKVTRSDIDAARLKDSSRCVVATAIKRSIPGAQRVSVDVQSIRFSIGDERFVYLTPPVVTGYVVAFDAGEPIHPFNFRLRPDQEVQVRTRRRTEAGKAKLRASERAQRLARKADQAQEQLKGMNHTPPDGLPAPTAEEVKAKRREVRDANAAAASAAAERAAVMAAYVGETVVESPDHSLRPAIPKVFRRTERAYGIRQLRINQPENPDRLQPG